MNDRRATIFLAFAITCAILIPLTDPQFRWVPIATAIAYVVLAVAAAVDTWSRSRTLRRRERASTGAAPDRAET